MGGTERARCASNRAPASSSCNGGEKPGRGAVQDDVNGERNPDGNGAGSGGRGGAAPGRGQRRRAHLEMEWGHREPRRADILLPELVKGATAVERRSLNRRARAGDVIALARNVYLPACTWNELGATDRGLVRHAAAAAATRTGVLVGRSAALAHGFPVRDIDPSPVEIGHPRDRRTRMEGQAVHRWLRWPEADIEEIGGIRVTAAGPTVVDVALRHGFEEGLMVADAALAMGHPRSELAAAAMSLRSPGAAAEVVAHADGESGSPGESAARAQLIRAGILGAVPQVNVFTAGKVHLGRVDLLLPRELVVVEFHGSGKFDGVYGDGGARFSREWWRERRLVAAGLGTVHVGWQDVEAGRVPDMVRAAIRERAALLAVGRGFDGYFLPASQRWPDGFMTWTKAQQLEERRREIEAFEHERD